MSWSTLIVDVAGFADRLDAASRTTFLTKPGTWIARLDGINRARAVWDIQKLGSSGLAAWAETGVEVQIEPDSGASALSAAFLALECLNGGDPTTMITMITGKSGLGPIARLAAQSGVDFVAMADTANESLLDDALTLELFGFKEGRGMQILASNLARASARAPEPAPAVTPEPRVSLSNLAPAATIAAAAATTAMMAKAVDAQEPEPVIVPEPAVTAEGTPAEAVDDPVIADDVPPGDVPAIDADALAEEILASSDFDLGEITAAPAEEPLASAAIAGEAIAAEPLDHDPLDDDLLVDLDLDLDQAISRNLESAMTESTPEVAPQANSEDELGKEVDDLLARLLSDEAKADDDQGSSDEDPLDSIFSDMVASRD